MSIQISFFCLCPFEDYFYSEDHSAETDVSSHVQNRGVNISSKFMDKYQHFVTVFCSFPMITDKWNGDIRTSKNLADKYSVCFIRHKKKHDRWVGIRTRTLVYEEPNFVYLKILENFF